jgi:cytochrome b561
MILYVPQSSTTVPCSMQIKNTESKYGVIAQLFHWTIVVLVVTQFVLAQKAHGLPRGPALLATLATHKSVGITIFALAIARLIWRWINPVPPMPSSTPRWQQLAARISHIGLYSLLLLMPIFGWMMSSARNFPVSWFGQFTLPDLIGPNEQAYRFFHEGHEFLARVLFFLALVHIAAALKHQFIDRDDLLLRMLPWNRKGRSKH